MEVLDDEQMDEARLEAKRKERLREAKKTIHRALKALQGIGFLDSFEITRSGVVRVVRAKRRKSDG